MFHSLKILKQLVCDRRAVTALEYGFISSVLVGSIMVGANALGTDLSSLFQGLGDCVANPAGCVTFVQGGGSLSSY